MTSQCWDEDDPLLKQLRAAVRQAGTPTPPMIAAGEAAFSWRTVDAELAALTHDSFADESGLVRSSAAPRSLVFEGRELSVELDQTDDGPVRTTRARRDRRAGVLQLHEFGGWAWPGCVVKPPQAWS